jgi:hypothetical protein
MMLRRFAPAAIVAAALAMAPAALANTTATGYDAPGGTQQHHVTTPQVRGVTNGTTCSNSHNSGTSGSICGPTAPATVTPASTTGSLPFTGYDLILVLATGAGLVTAGFGLRRLTRRESRF